MTEVYILGIETPIIAKRSYQTMKKYLYDGREFINFTTNLGDKMVVRKSSIEMIRDYIPSRKDRKEIKG